jgi:four helix bundle protein
LNYQIRQALNRFEDLKIWQDARRFNKNLFNVLLLVDDMKFGFLKNHLFKTSGSIMDNIAEGFEREGNKEFIQFLYYSKGSAGEIRSQLYRAFDLNLISKENFNDLSKQLLNISSQLSLFIKYLKNSEFKGAKFKESRENYEINLSIENFIDSTNESLNS